MIGLRSLLCIVCVGCTSCACHAKMLVYGWWFSSCEIAHAKHWEDGGIMVQFTWCTKADASSVFIQASSTRLEATLNSKIYSTMQYCIMHLKSRCTVYWGTAIFDGYIWKLHWLHQAVLLYIALFGARIVISYVVSSLFRDLLSSSECIVNRIPDLIPHKLVFPSIDRAPLVCTVPTFVTST